MWLDTTVPLLVRFGFAALMLGLVVLFVSVVRHRIASWKGDPYKEIRR